MCQIYVVFFSLLFVYNSNIDIRMIKALTIIKIQTTRKRATEKMSHAIHGVRLG